MNCRDAQNLLSAYVDRQLAAWQHTEVAGHVKSCAECQHAVLNLIQIKRLLRELPMPSLPPETLAAIRAETCAKTSPWKEWFSKPWWIPTLALGAALGGWLFLRLYPSHSRADARVQMVQPPRTTLPPGNVLVAVHKEKGEKDEAVR